MNSKNLSQTIRIFSFLCPMRSLLQVNRRSFAEASSAAKEEFLKTFLVRIQYTNPTDAYYETYPHRQQFRKQVKTLQDTNKCFIMGGDLFPFQSTQLVFNCDQKSVVENFLQKNIYQDKKLIKGYEIEEVEKISQEKMKKLSYFYQYA